MNGGTRAETKRHSAISVGNWIWTVFLSLIPGVNVITFIVLIVVSKVPTKRNFAIASLIVAFLLVLLYLAAIMFFPDSLIDLLTGATNSIAGT